jgi:hypothetical protein
MTKTETHPVQKGLTLRGRTPARVPTTVTMRAYEVYCHIWGPQKALTTGDCRGGFAMGELIALLYAYPFPKDEWYGRFQEAITGMEGI